METRYRERIEQDRYLTAAEIGKIPESHLPLMVLSDNMTSFFSWGIKSHEKGVYNHFMWMHRPGFFASQDWLYREVPVTEYTDGVHRLKLVTNIFWPDWKREILKARIRHDLQKPWYRRIYDPLQVVGKLVGADGLQVPGLSICSDHGEILRKIDQEFDLCHPSPVEINQCLKDHRERGYRVYGRFVPD